jgi:hypothetical protein
MKENFDEVNENFEVENAKREIIEAEHDKF